MIAYRGLALYLTQLVLFTVDTVFIHTIGTGATVMQVALARNVGLLIIAFIMFGPTLRVFVTSLRWLQMLRAVVSVITMWLVVYSFVHLELSDATAISYTQAGFLTLLSFLLLGESVPSLRWLALVVGFAGTLMMIRPVFVNFEWAYIVALGAAACNALMLVISKPLLKADQAATIVAYVASVGILCNVPGLFIAPLPDLHLWPWFLGLLICGPIGQLAGILAVRYADISMLAPWLYLRLVLAAAFGGALFSEAVNLWTLIGATIVFVSCGLTFTKAKVPSRT